MWPLDATSHYRVNHLIFNQRSIPFENYYGFFAGAAGAEKQAAGWYGAFEQQDQR